MSCDLVTGLQAETHISAEQDGLLNIGLFGPDNYLLDTQDRLPATITSANTVIIGTGDFLMQGRHVTCQEPETLTLTSGTTGFSRIDLIVARYTKDAITGIEDVSLTVLEGEAVQNGTPVEPSYTTGNIVTGGALLNELPIYRVQINDLVPQEPVKLLTTCIQTIYALQTELAKKISTDKLENGAVTSVKLANNSVTGAKIADGSVATTDIANNAITTEKVADKNITNAKLADGAVNSAKIADNSIIASKIPNFSISTEKIADGAISADKIPNGAISAQKLASSISSGMAESGTKDGWWYIKYASGIMICGKTITGNTYSIKTAWGSLFCSAYVAGQTYPFKFVEHPAVSMHAIVHNGAAWMVPVQDGGSQATPGYYYVSPKSESSKSVRETFLAIGRWK